MTYEYTPEEESIEYDPDYVYEPYVDEDSDEYDDEENGDASEEEDASKEEEVTEEEPQPTTEEVWQDLPSSSDSPNEEATSESG